MRLNSSNTRYICETNRGIQEASFKVWSLSSHCSKSSSIPQKNYFFFKRVMQTRVNSETITNLPYLLLNDASSRRISRSFAHNRSESPYLFQRRWKSNQFPCQKKANISFTHSLLIFLPIKRSACKSLCNMIRALTLGATLFFLKGMRVAPSREFYQTLSMV